MAIVKLSIAISLFSVPTMGLYSDTKAVAFQGPESELSLLIFNFATDNLIHIPSDKHAYNQQTRFSDKVIHSNLTEMRNVFHQNKTKM